MADEPKPKLSAPEQPNKELPYYLQEIRDRHRDPEFPNWVWHDLESRPHRYPPTRIQRFAVYLIAAAMAWFVVFMLYASRGSFLERFSGLSFSVGLAGLLVYSLWKSLNRR